MARTVRSTARRAGFGDAGESSGIGLGEAVSAPRKPLIGEKDARIRSKVCLPDLRVEIRSVSGLKAHSRNPRTHSKKQIDQIAASIRQFGFTIPLLIGPDDRIIAGHGRLEAARLLGMTEVPTICRADMTEAQIRAYVIADNKLAEQAGWNRELLAAEFQYIAELDVEFDLTLTGFETAEIDILLTDACDDADEWDDVPDLSACPPVTQLGDCWLIEEHRIFCGDARVSQSYERVLESRRAQMVITDPPYNVPIAGHVSGLGATKHREFPMAVGEMSADQYVAFLKSVFQLLAASSIDGSIHFIFIDWRHIWELLSAAQEVYSEFKNLCVWTKDNGGMGSLYRSKHELIAVFKNGSSPHINNVELGKYGRYRTNVWEYAGVNTLREGRLDELAMHPTPKPAAMIADAILDCSKRGGLVLDSFGGSGTSLVAAHTTGRQAALIELDPVYVDTTIQRFWKLTGQEAVHADSGLTYSQMKERRSESVPASGEAAAVGEAE